MNKLFLPSVLLTLFFGILLSNETKAQDFTQNYAKVKLLYSGVSVKVQNVNGLLPLEKLNPGDKVLVEHYTDNFNYPEDSTCSLNKNTFVSDMHWFMSNKTYSKDTVFATTNAVNFECGGNTTRKGTHVTTWEYRLAEVQMVSVKYPEDN